MAKVATLHTSVAGSCPAASSRVSSSVVFIPCLKQLRVFRFPASSSIVTAQSIRVVVQESDHTTWHECFSCAFNFIDLASEPVQTACEEQQWSLHNRNCSKPHYGFLDHGLYGAQLAWWLRFFPPEQFLIISAWELRDPAQRIEVRAQLNRLFRL